MCFSMFIIVIVTNFIMCECVMGRTDLFHQKSKITFRPDRESKYFGYSVVLTNSSLIVGAPKAVSRVKETIAPGQVFTCRLKQGVQNITCYPFGMDDSEHDKSIRRLVNVKEFFRDDMWFGASIATVPEGKLFVCAPRWADPYRDKHLLATGACYVETKRRGITLTPLMDRYRLAYTTDGARREYGEYGTNLNFFAHGQAGMSIKVTENNSILIGAPGLLQWTGGIIDYRFIPDPNSVFFNKQPIPNPYFTKDLGPDDYFGYSVESGIFETNGSTLYVAGAPRSKLGYGQVLIFEPPIREHDPLNIRAKLRGPQLGSYFGATLCCTDINGDGKADLLVGAPNYVTKEDEMPYDQGAVFVYLAGVSPGEVPSLIFEETGHVSIGENGARFGSAISALGDVDGDGYNDVAIGAPWEMDGVGAVYIYRGSSKGLKRHYAQKIIAEDARGFGISISKALDIDDNNCNDLAIGAHDSGTAYLYLCVPTIQLHASIKVPDAMNLPKNVTSFSAHFCVKSPPNEHWPHVKLDLKATITIDQESNRASTKKDSDYKVTAKPGNTACDEQTIEVKPTADLTKPILIKMDLELMEPFVDNYQTVPKDAARISEDSNLNTSFLIQLIRDCGDDLICTPLLILTLEAIESVYIPGASNRLGVKVSVLNKEEPAYGAKVYLRLPLPPKRVPGFCSLEGLNMTCDVNSPLERGKSQEWEVELEHSLQGVDEEILKFEAELEHPLFIRNDNKKEIKEVSITVVPKADFKISGKILPNNTMNVTREKFYEAGNISFIHFIEITNSGPSDWILLQAVLKLPQNVTLSSSINGCEISNGNLTCSWSVPANASIPLALSYKYDLKKYGEYLEDFPVFNATTRINLLTNRSESLSMTTTLVLEPAKPIWPLIVIITISVIIGLLLLAGIVYLLYKYGFFSRKIHEDAIRQKLKEDGSSTDEGPECSTNPGSLVNESTQELLSEDSD